MGGPGAGLLLCINPSPAEPSHGPRGRQHYSCSVDRQSGAQKAKGKGQPKITLSWRGAEPGLEPHLPMPRPSGQWGGSSAHESGTQMCTRLFGCAPLLCPCQPGDPTQLQGRWFLSLLNCTLDDDSGSQCALVGLGCYNKIPPTGWLGHTIISHSSEG